MTWNIGLHPSAAALTVILLGRLRPFTALVAFCVLAVGHSSTAMARQLCETELENRSSHIFSREANDSLDPIYLQNMKRVSFAFEKILTQTNPITDLKGILREQHRLAVLGEAPETFYWPSEAQAANSRALPISLKFVNMVVGKYRTEIDMNALPLIQYTTSSEAVVAEIQARAVDQRTETSYLVGTPTFNRLPAISGIPREAGPRYNVVSSKIIKFEYPAAVFIPKYLSAMQDSLERIRLQMHKKDRDLNETLRELGHYYHLSTVAHLFRRVNNSMAMAQVNVVLTHLDLKPVRHGDLDYILRCLDSAQAEAAFVDFVWKQQNP